MNSAAHEGWQQGTFEWCREALQGRADVAALQLALAQQHAANLALVAALRACVVHLEQVQAPVPAQARDTLAQAQVNTPSPAGHRYRHENT